MSDQRSAALDWANEDLYQYARERDRLLWLVDALRKIRDARMRGEDGKKETFLFVARVDAIKAAGP